MKLRIVWITATFIFLGCAHSKTLNKPYQESFSFKDGPCEIHVCLESLGSNINRIIVLKTDNNEVVNSRAALLPWPIYQFQAGDIDADGITDLFVGVIKACPYDPVVRRRLFVYELIDGDIMAKWRGTRVSYELKEFRAIDTDGNTRIRTLEQDEEGIYHVVTYAWASFGPRLINNLEGGKDYEKAYKIYTDDTFFNLASDNGLSQ